MMGTLRNVIVTAGIGKALAATISEGAALQQSLGGVETLFKENAAQVAASAQEAYRTAGLSAKRVYGDRHRLFGRRCRAWAETPPPRPGWRPRPIADMADNANKFGTRHADCAGHLSISGARQPMKCWTT